LGESDIFDGCARFCPAGDLETLVVRGPDADDFLQRLISCDLKKVNSGSGSRGTLLEAKGRLLAFFDIHRLADGLLIVTDREQVDILGQQLERIIILEDVELCRGDHAVISIQGRGSVTRAQEITSLSPDQFLASASWRDGLVVNRPRCSTDGFDFIVPVSQLAQLERDLKNHGVALATEENSEHARIEAGFPRIGYEVTARTLPPEVGLDDAISYDKGCYAGQEVLARIRTYGHVNRQLRRLSFSDAEGSDLPAIELGDDLFADDSAEKAVARVTSVAQGHAVVHLLASVRRSHAEEGTQLQWRDEDGQHRYSSAVKLPFRP